MTALKSGDLNVLSQLVSSGADLNSPGKKILLSGRPEQQPQVSSNPLIWAVDVDNLEAVRLLLEKGADPNICCEYAHTSRTCWLRPLCHTTNHCVASMLLDAGADVNAQQRSPIDTETALLKASSTHPSIGELLIERGADVNITSEKGGTALCRAIFHRHEKLVERLVRVSWGIW